MAGPYYVRSTDGNDADSGLTWALAKATLAGALAVAAAGERIWVSQAHAETQASAMTLTAAGTAAAPVEILCGNDAATPPTALATTATVSTTGASAIAFGAGFAYVYGIIFQAASGASSGNINIATTLSDWAFDTCELALIGTNAASAIVLGLSASQQFISLKNTTIRRSAVGQTIALRQSLLWNGGSIAGTAPTTIFTCTSARLCNVRSIGVDLSLGTTNLVDVAGTGVIRLEQCKLGAGVALTTGTNSGRNGVVILLDNCDSADTQYRMQRHQYEGDVYSETTIVRTGGASDGTTPLSHKMVSSANSKFYAPLYGPEFWIHNTAVGAAKTVTVEIVHDSLTALTDAEVWLEVEVLTTTGFPLATFPSDRAADILATPVAQTASTIAWTTTGLTNPNKQKLAVTFTPQEIGIFRCRVALAKASYTVYYDALAVVS